MYNQLYGFLFVIEDFTANKTTSDATLSQLKGRLRQFNTV